MFARIVLHPHLTATLHEVKNLWTLDDVWRMHSWLDALDTYLKEEQQRLEEERDG